MNTETCQQSEPAPAQCVPAGALLVLMYHNLSRDDAEFAALSPSITSYFVTADRFSNHLRQLESAGVRWLDPRSLYDYFRHVRRASTGTAQERNVLLTFDDGWKGAVELGAPVLQAHRCTSLYFVTTGFLGKAHFLSRYELAALPSDLFRVGSHASTHRMLRDLPDDDIRAELKDSKEELEDIVGYEVDSLSIPGGAVDARVRRIAAELGYRLVFDSEVRLNRPHLSPLQIGRVSVMEGTSSDAIGRFGRHRIGRERVRRAILSAPKRFLGLRRYQRLRRALLGETGGVHKNHEP